MKKFLRQLFCRHRVRVLELERESPTVVYGYCRCGKKFSGPYGLALKVPLDWK